MTVYSKSRDQLGSVSLTVLLAAIGAASLARPITAEAHHSPSAFDTKQSMTIAGVVKKYEWFNPHVYVTIEQSTDDGQKIEWEVECYPPSAMSRMGWNKETLRVGDVLSITGSPGRLPGSKGFLAGSIKRADNTLLDSGSLLKQFAPVKDAPQFVAKHLDGTWLTQANFQLVAQLAFPNAAQMTVDGAQTFKNFDEKTMSPSSNCVPGTSPATMVMPDMKRIEMSDSVMVIRGEYDGGQRTIHLNAITGDTATLSHQGYSVAKWEDKTLVIETTRFAYHGNGNGIGLPSGTKKRLLEWFTPSADGTSLTYRFEIHDPEFLKAPRSGEVKWTYRPDMKFSTEPCSLDSARRFIKH